MPTAIRDASGSSPPHAAVLTVSDCGIRTLASLPIRFVEADLRVRRKQEEVDRSIVAADGRARERESWCG
jgi:hypothetical protein